MVNINAQEYPKGSLSEKTVNFNGGVQKVTDEILKNQNTVNSFNFNIPKNTDGRIYC